MPYNVAPPWPSIYFLRLKIIKLLNIVIETVQQIESFNLSKLNYLSAVL